MAILQKALLIPAKGASFVVGPCEVPKPGRGQILVKVHAAALNLVDGFMQRTGLFITEYPAIVGCDAAGTVEEIGDDVTSFSKGDRVYVHFVCPHSLLKLRH